MPPKPEFSISVGESIAFGEGDGSLDFHSVREAGFRAVELCLYFKQPRFYTADDAARVAQRAGEADIRLHSMHGFTGPLDQLTLTPEMYLAVNLNIIEFMRRLDMKTLVLHLPIATQPDLPCSIANARAALDVLVTPAREAGITLAVENTYDPAQYDAKEFFQAIFNAYDEEEVGLCYDSGHALMTSEEDLLECFGERLAAVHLHDNDAINDLHLPPGQGLADWQFLRYSIQSSRLTGPIHLEVSRTEEGSPQDFLRQAYNAVATVWNDT
jgi:sugar phosphate isomerase/epimerase